VATTAQLTNPSPFGVEIGTLGVDLYYDGLFLGPAETFAPINLTSGVNQVSLGGRLVDHTGDQAALDKLGIVFSNYLNGVATPVQAVGRSVTLPGGVTPAWLVQGIKPLVLNVPLKSPTGRISPIKSITIQTFNLAYTPQTAYAPTASSPLVLAGIGLPFGFSLSARHCNRPLGENSHDGTDISDVRNSFNIVQNNTLIAGLNGDYGAAVTELQTRNAGFTTGQLTLELPPAPLVIENSYEAHRTLDQFQSDFANGPGSNFFLNGSTNAITSTPIGQVSLKDIGFTVPAGLIGLSGLTLYPTLILSVDVTGGTPDYIILSINGAHRLDQATQRCLRPSSWPYQPVQPEPRRLRRHVPAFRSGRILPRPYHLAEPDAHHRLSRASRRRPIFGQQQPDGAADAQRLCQRQGQPVEHRGLYVSS
jgi:hypothetical protein